MRDLMCDVDEYDKQNVPMPDDASIVCVRPLSSTSSKGALILLGHTINFIDYWLQWLEEKYNKRIVIYKENMSDQFKSVPTQLQPK